MTDYEKLIQQWKNIERAKRFKEKIKKTFKLNDAFFFNFSGIFTALFLVVYFEEPFNEYNIYLGILILLGFLIISTLGISFSIFSFQYDCKEKYNKIIKNNEHDFDLNLKNNIDSIFLEADEKSLYEDNMELSKIILEHKKQSDENKKTKDDEIDAIKKEFKKISEDKIKLEIINE